MHEVVVSHAFGKGARRVELDNLLADKCDRCGELSWSEVELRRVDKLLEYKRVKAAA